MTSKNSPNDNKIRSTSTNSDCFPSELKSRDQWIVADTSGGKKKPFVPWRAGARGSWRDPNNQGHFDQAMRVAEQHENYKLGFVFKEDDPFVFVDFDDACDPESGEIDPAVADLIRRAESYTDVSTSGTGLHIILEGSLPDEAKAISAPIGNGGASVEVYDRRRFAVMTGQHLTGAPQQCHNRQDLIDELNSENRSIHENTPDDILDDPERGQQEIKQIETTTDPDVVWDAVRHTEPSDISLKSEQTETRPDGTASLDPSWEHSESGTRIGQFDDGFVYRNGMIGLDCLQMVALEEGIIRDPRDYPEGEDYFDAVDALRARGAPIPMYRSPRRDDEERQFRLPAIPDLKDRSLAQIREEAEEEGVMWPSTEEVRDRLSVRLRQQLQRASDTVIEAPTAAGKTHIVATTAWADQSNITGGAPVLHLSKTRKARDEAYEMSQQAGVDAVRLRAGEESCPVAAGNYDSDNLYGNESLDHLVSGEQSVSEWMHKQTERKAIPHSRVHGELEQRYKRTHDKLLPCCRGSECESVEQWDFIDLDQSFEPQELPDIIHATHQFARITGFVEGANVVFDEQPAFRLDTDSERLRDGIESFLREIEAPIETWEEFVLAATNKECTLGLSGLCEAVRSDPSSEWYFDNSEAHVYIPAIVRALVDADHVGNNRYAGEVEHQPFYRGGGESESGMERVMVVLNERHEFELIKITPPLHSTRCVIGLDAHPDLERWRLDTLPSMTVEQVLCDEERHNWRRFERGLFVIQVGESDRPLTRADNFSEGKTSALIDELTEEMPELRTAITSKAVEEQIGELLPDSDVSEPVLHYGEELSRNDFADERTGLLVGCIDPGDDTVLNWLAIQGAEAAPERSNQTCGECDGSGCYECLDTGYKRERGRGFRGPDADAAEALVASVRETHVAQAIGRYARDADHPDEPTVVFVWTAAIPDEMVDSKIPDVRSFTDNQERVVEYVCENGPVPTREIADALDLTKEAARTTLSELAEMGPVAIERCAGKHGAHLYDIDRSVEGFLYLDDYDEGEATTITTTATRAAAEG